MLANGIRAMGLAAGAVHLAFAASAHAQSNADVVAEAEDAFGTRIGLERIGIYSESQVRGFSLAQAANYQVDGVYVATVSAPGNPILAGVTTRVGWNALQSDLPAPSGIVDYSITSPAPGTRTYLELGLLERQSPYAFGTVSTRDTRGQWGFSAGVQTQPYSQRIDGERSSQVGAGFVAEWRPSSQTSVKTFASASDFEAPGDWGFLATETALPPTPDYPKRYAANGTRTSIRQYLVGAIGRTKSDSWDLHAGAFYSGLELNPVDVTLLPLDRTGQGRALAIFSQRGTGEAFSGEIKASYRLSASNRIFASARGRRTIYHTPRSTVVDLGPVNIEDDLNYGATPPTAPPVLTRDVIEQFEGILGFETRIAERLLLRGALRKAFYEKAISPPNLPTSAESNEPWLYSGQAILALSKTITAFATYARGIEESGSAPATATNRFAPLPAVTATQAELGLNAKLSPKLSFIASVFQVEKPTPGFDGAGAYRLVNNERHRGLELSLTGEVAKALTVVVGAAFLEPTLAGDLVDAGAQASRPVGVSSILANASFSYSVTKVPGLSIDGQVSYNGPRLVHPNGDLEAPGFAVANVGGRYGFSLGKYAATIRLLVSNAINGSAWQAASSQVIQRTAPRAARLTFSIRG